MLFPPVILWADGESFSIRTGSILLMEGAGALSAASPSPGSGDFSGPWAGAAFSLFPRKTGVYAKPGLSPAKFSYKNRKTTLHSVEDSFRRGVLPLADGAVVVAVDHVIHVDAGEPICHIRYHFLSSFVHP